MPRLEKHRWIADFSAPGGKPNRRSFTYEAFVPDPLQGFGPSLPVATVALLAEAEQAVQALNLDPPKLASLEVLARRLLRAEAIASSWIEGLRISQRRLAQAEVRSEEERDVTAKSVLGNVAAMDAAVELGSNPSELSVADVLGIHRVLMASTNHPHLAGQLRTSQNWIGGTSYNPLNAVFVPPPHDLVEPLMEDLVRFASRTDLPAVVQAAVAHAQFETIHPFGDGNGRTGRALIHVVLRRRGLTPRFVPPVSLVLATNASEYIAGLIAFREGRVSEWLDNFSRALRAAATKSASLARNIAEMQERWRRMAGNPRADSSAEALIVALPAYPVLTAASAAKMLNRSVQAANTALAALESAGVVKQVSLGRRNRAFEAPELLMLVDSFERELAIPDAARRSARRTPIDGQ